jgi:hypothetical protein
MSMKAIAKEVGASLSSVSRWVRDVELSKEQRAMLELQAFNGHVKGRAIHSAVRRGARVLAQEEGRQLAERRETLHVAGCMLYWAEGAKDRNQIRPPRTPTRNRAILARNVGTPAVIASQVTINVYSKYSKKKRMNKLPYGTCRVVVSRTRIVQSIFGSIQEYAGFERPAWLE